MCETDLNLHIVTNIKLQVYNKIHISLNLYTDICFRRKEYLHKQKAVYFSQK